MSARLLQFALLFLLAFVLAATVTGGRVLHQCNNACSEKFAEEIKANNMNENDNLVKMVINCVEDCMDKVNKILHERGLDDLVEPFTRDESE